MGEILDINRLLTIMIKKDNSLDVDCSEFYDHRINAAKHSCYVQSINELMKKKRILISKILSNDRIQCLSKRCSLQYKHRINP